MSVDPVRHFPIDGRAARTIRLPGWKPPVMLSRSSKPEGVPVIALPCWESCSSLVISTSRTSLIARRRVVGVHARLDLVRGPQQPAQHRVLAHDPRVLAHVADRGDAGGEQVDRRAAAGLLELARLLEVLDQRERVDGFAAVVEVEHRREYDPVRVAVEVLRMQPLVDDQRGERRIGQQHGAEDGLLGLEVLRRGYRPVRQARGGMAVGGRALGDAHGPPESRSRTGALPRTPWILRRVVAEPRPAAAIRRPGYFCSTTMVLTVAVTPLSTSTTTIRVPTVLIGSSRWTWRLSIVMPRASLMASAMSWDVTAPKRRPSSPA